MKLKLLGVLTSAVLVFPLVGLSPGCSGPDNPKIPDVPPPAAPKPEEVQTHTTKVSGKKIEYGTHPKYKQAMDRLNK